MDKSSKHRHAIELANEAMPTSACVSVGMHMADFLRTFVKATTPEGRIDEMRRFVRRNPHHPKSKLLEAALSELTGHFQLLFGLMWAELAYPYVVVEEKTAAALCTTASDKELAEVLTRSPWEVFLVAVPSGLFPWRNGSYVTAIQVVARPAGGKFLWSFQVSGADDSLAFISGNISPEDFATDAFVSGLDDDDPCQLTEEEARVVLVCRRLVRGVVLWMLDPERRAAAQKADVLAASQPAPPDVPTSDPGHQAPLPPVARPPQKPRDRKLLVGGYAITAPVQVDCREHVRSYLRGDRASPGVRSLVRGHHKMQPCGPKGQQRKHIWIEPHWRGQDGLAIAVKNHKVGA